MELDLTKDERKRLEEDGRKSIWKDVDKLTERVSRRIKKEAEEEYQALVDALPAGADFSPDELAAQALMKAAPSMFQGTAVAALAAQAKALEA